MGRNVPAPEPTPAPALAPSRDTHVRYGPHARPRTRALAPGNRAIGNTYYIGRIQEGRRKYKGTATRSGHCHSQRTRALVPAHHASKARGTPHEAARDSRRVPFGVKRRRSRLLVLVLSCLPGLPAEAYTDGDGSKTSRLNSKSVGGV